MAYPLTVSSPATIPRGGHLAVAALPVDDTDAVMADRIAAAYG